MLDSDVQTIANTEHRLMGTKCPICQEPFKSGQKLKKYRCGHAVCIECFKQSKDEGWTRCTVCRRSRTTQTIRTNVEPTYDVDLSVFVQTESSASAAAAAAEINTSDDFIPRLLVVENQIKHHRDSIEEFDNAIDSLLDQL
ncbi:MAG: RING finger domain-containing protein, partial [Candidatus Fonsibacter sp.]